MKIPKSYQVPPEMEEAMLVVETGFTPDELDKMPQSLIYKMIMYQNVREVAKSGGEYNI